MGAFYQESITLDSSNYGTNAKKIISWIIEKARLDIVEVVSDTTATYSVYVSAFGSSDVVYKLYNSSGNLYSCPYFYTGSGSYTVNGVSGYGQVDGNGYATSATSLTQGATYTLCACVADCIIAFGVKNNTFEGLFFKAKEMCSGATYYGAYTFDTNSCRYPYFSLYGLAILKDNLANEISRESMETANNGYIRARPLVFYSSALSFFGQLTNPTDLCHIVSDGAALSNTCWTEYTIAGHTFVGTGTSGSFIKIS